MKAPFHKIYPTIRRRYLFWIHTQTTIPRDNYIYLDDHVNRLTAP